MRFRHVATGLLAAALALAAPAVALADGGPHGRGGFGQDPLGHMLLRMGDKLGLTDQQRSQLHAILDQGRQAAQPLRDQLRNARREFVAAHDPATFDEDAIRAEAKAEAPILENLRVQMASTRAQALAVLTPDQRIQLQLLKNQFMQKHAAGSDTNAR